MARRCIASFVERYNTFRLDSAIGYITHQGKLLGNDLAIITEATRPSEGYNQWSSRRMAKAKGVSAYTVQKLWRGDSATTSMQPG